MARFLAMEAIIPRFRNDSAELLRYSIMQALSAFRSPWPIFSHSWSMFWQWKRLEANARKMRSSACRHLNAPMSTSEPTAALATLREHSARRLQGLNFHPGEDSLSLRMRNHVLSRLKATL